MVSPRARASRSHSPATAIALSVAQEWADARSAGHLLGVSEKTLGRWRKAGFLQAGVHWRRKFPSGNSPVLYHLERCNNAMNEATARSAALLET
ncbi:MAG: hypothetical protein ACK6BC_15035 [Cyanobacteriota bacterium]|jgi:hypothetical protein